MPNPSRLVYSQSMGSLGPVRVQRRAATNGVARCYAAAAMRATNSSVSVTMRLDKKSSSSRSHKLRVSQRPVAALGIGSRAVRCGPSTPGHSHLDRAGSAPTTTPSRHFVCTRRRSAVVIPTARAARLAPQPSECGSCPGLVRTHPVNSTPQQDHGARGHVQRRARW